MLAIRGYLYGKTRLRWLHDGVAAMMICGGPLPDHYQVLGIQRTATQEEVEAAFSRVTAARRSARPGGSEPLPSQRAIAEAHYWLRSPGRRQEYDRRLAEEEEYERLLKEHRDAYKRRVAEQGLESRRQLIAAQQAAPVHGDWPHEDEQVRSGVSQDSGIQTGRAGGGSWYRIGYAVSWVIIFAGCWIYCVGAYGFLLGVGLGWLPSAIAATVISFFWPLEILLMVCVALYIAAH